MPHPPPAIPDDPRGAEDAIIVVHVSGEDCRPIILPAWLARELGSPIPSEMVQAVIDSAHLKDSANNLPAGPLVTSPGLCR